MTDGSLNTLSDVNPMALNDINSNWANSSGMISQKSMLKLASNSKLCFHVRGNLPGIMLNNLGFKIAGQKNRRKTKELKMKDCENEKKGEQTKNKMTESSHIPDGNVRDVRILGPFCFSSVSKLRKQNSQFPKQAKTFLSI